MNFLKRGRAGKWNKYKISMGTILFLLIVYKLRPGIEDAKLVLCVSLPSLLKYFAAEPTQKSLTKIGKTWQERGFEVIPFTSKVLIGGSEVCRRSDVSLLIYIHSAVSNFRKRDVIRRTWGKYMNQNQNKIMQLVFIIGSDSTDSNFATQKLVVSEYAKHRDILQFGIADTYHMVTYKELEMLNWLQNNCKSTQYFMRTDDDCIINIWPVARELKAQVPFGIQPKLENNPPKQQLDVDNVHSSNRDMLLIGCGGEFLKKAMVHRCGKYAAPIEEYPDSMYPPYCNGVSFVLTYSSIRRLIQASSKAQFTKNDDVFVTGILPFIDGSIKPRLIPGYNYIQSSRELRFHRMFYPREDLKGYLVLHINDDENLFVETWEDLLKMYQGD